MGRNKKEVPLVFCEPATLASLDNRQVYLDDGADREWLHTLLLHVSEKGREILDLIYVQGDTTAEVGERLRITASRVSQIHMEALRCLRRTSKERRRG